MSSRSTYFSTHSSLIPSSIHFSSIHISSSHYHHANSCSIMFKCFIHPPSSISGSPCVPPLQKASQVEEGSPLSFIRVWLIIHLLLNHIYENHRNFHALSFILSPSRSGLPPRSFGEQPPSQFSSYSFILVYHPPRSLSSSSSCFINLHSSRHRPCQDHPSSQSLWSITTLIHPHHVIQLSLQRTHTHAPHVHILSFIRSSSVFHSFIWVSPNLKQESRVEEDHNLDITFTFIHPYCMYKGVPLPANFAESRSVGRSHVYELTWHVHSHPSCSHPIPMQWTPPLFAVLENLARMAINKHKNSLWLCVCMYSRTCLKQYCLIQ